MESHSSASLRAGFFAKRAKHGAPSFMLVSAYSRFLTGLSARFGMTKFSWLAARLKSSPSGAWRFPNPQRDGVVESHSSASPSASAKQGRLLRKVREEWGTLGGWVRYGKSKSPPCRKKRDKDGAPRVVVASAYSRFLTGLSARFGMTRFVEACGAA